MAQSVTRQWPALPTSDPESLALWARQITQLLQNGGIANSATDFLTPAEGDAAYVNVTGDTMTGDLVAPGVTVTDFAGLALTGNGGAGLGGRFTLVNPPSGTSLAGSESTIGINGNSVVFHENGGSVRGAGLDLTACAAGAASELTIKASDAEIRAATAGSRAITADRLESASAFVNLADAATIAVDWDTGINFAVRITADRVLGNPTNGQPGTWRTLYIDGNNATDRTLTFGAQYLGEVPVLTDIDSGRAYLLTIMCIAASHFAVSAKRVFG